MGTKPSEWHRTLHAAAYALGVFKRLVDVSAPSDLAGDRLHDSVDNPGLRARVIAAQSDIFPPRKRKQFNATARGSCCDQLPLA